MATDEKLVAELEERLAEVLRSTSDADRSRTRRDQIIRDAIARGATKYRIAQITGLSQAMVGKIASGRPLIPERVVTDADIDALEAILHDAGITSIPRLKRRARPDLDTRPWFCVRWVSDLPAKDLPGWKPENEALFGDDPEAPVTIDDRVFSVDPDYPHDWRTWVRNVYVAGPRGGKPVRVVEGLSSWWREEMAK